MEIHKVLHPSRHVVAFFMSCLGELFLGKCRYGVRKFIFLRGYCRHKLANNCKIGWPCLSKDIWQTVVCNGGVRAPKTWKFTRFCTLQDMLLITCFMERTYISLSFFGGRQMPFTKISRSMRSSRGGVRNIF